MTATLNPSAGEKFDNQIDLARAILETGLATEVELNLNGISKFMRPSNMSTENIRKFIWCGYKK